MDLLEPQLPEYEFDHGANHRMVFHNQCGFHENSLCKNTTTEQMTGRERRNGCAETLA
ncbi:hypothetical protein D3C87_2040660 [compost metagenome]